MRKTPYEVILEIASRDLPKPLLGSLPRKWERFGDVLILRFPKELEDHKLRVSKIYADVLKCRSILEDVGGIEGELRIPRLNLVYGDVNTETIHIENGIRFKFDPMKVMFSSGNMNERIRISKISNEDEIVVDMFAGIGYFSIPIAVYSKPKKVYAIEKNPIAFKYLKDNIVLNHVTGAVEPILGDNRERTPKNTADRIIMGYLKDTYIYLPYAIESLRDNEGMIHYHEICPNELLPRRPIRRIMEAAGRYGKKVDIIRINKVKSYAPGISHVVLDARLR